MHGYIFGLFTLNLLRQLQLLSPFILLGLILTGLGVWLLRRNSKAARLIIGHCILATLTALAVFILLMLLLNVTHTSYGQVRPLIVVFGSLYLVSLGVGLTGLGLLARWQRRPRLLMSLFDAAQVVVLLLVGYAFYIEPLWVDVTYTTLAETKMKSGSPPLKIALVSDLHIERWTRREDDVLKKLDALDPDLILLSGDYINVDYYRPETYDEMHRFFKGLHARHGIYAVYGVVDRPADMRRAVEGTQVQILSDEVRRLTINGQFFDLIGITADRQNEEQRLTALTAGLDSNVPRLLLYHTNKLAPESVQAGVDAYLSGHTHGGQIALPFFGAVITASKYPQYYSGLYDLGGPSQTKLYVTRGLGMEGFNTPRARLFARPEISVITLAPKANSGGGYR